MIRSLAMSHHPRRAATLVLVAAFLGCAGATAPPDSRLPGFARPQIFDPGEAQPTDDVIGYRELTRDDFRATAPPAHLGDNASQIGAATCAVIRIEPGGGFQAEATPTETSVWPVNLRYQVLMDRGCSWWNDEREGLSDAYVLEHEQVHFGIFEVEARRLTRRAQELGSISGPAGTDPAELVDEARLSIDRAFERSKEAVMARSLAFDEETSFGHAPEAQRRWRETLERELRALSP